MMRGTPRRDVLKLLGAASLTTASIAGCDILATDPTTEKAGPKNNSADVETTEAPMLADLVKSGDLPKLADRLPTSPLVVDPAERPGTYGGTWQSVILGTDAWYGHRIVSDYLMRWTPDSSEVIPNVAESVAVADDGRRYTFHLRAGMRWSDGEPFTAADVVYAANDVLLNEELYPAPPDWFLQGGQAPQVEALDDQTVQISLQQPSGVLLQYLAAAEGAALTAHPQHYLKQFHSEYNQAASTQATDEGYESWVEFHQAKSDSTANPDLPTISAWQSRTILADTSRMILERNPYYWKVDPDGRQLPYIDELALDVVTDNEIILLKASQGDLDMQIRYIDTLQNKPVLAQNRERGAYRFFDVVRDQMNTLVIALNLAHKDPVKREIFSTKDFRIGLSHAINRAEIIDTAYQRQGEPWQVAPKPDTEFYDEEMAKQYIEYDVDKANDHLDRAGYAQRDGDDRRLGPDGEPISVTIEYSTGLFPEWDGALALVKDYWDAVGVDTQLKSEDRTLFSERLTAGNHDAGVWQGDGGTKWAVLMRPYWYLPNNGTYSIFGPTWAQWYASRGAEGEEPPEWVLQQLDLYDELKATVDGDQQIALMRQILQINKEEFPAIGITYPATSFGVVKNSFHNVPETMLDEWLYGTPAQTNPQQYFISDE